MKTSAFKYIIHLYLAVLMTWMMSCNNAAEKAEAYPDEFKTDSISVAVDSTTAMPDQPGMDSASVRPILPDTAMIEKPTMIIPGNDHQASKKSATLGYSYPPVMHRKEPKDVNVYVSVKFPKSLVRDTLRKIVEEQTKHNSENDSSFIFTINVIWYKTLDITLIDPAGDFTITPIHPSNKQVVDTGDGNRWRWIIVTKTSKKAATMILKVIAEKEDGTIDRFDDRTIIIKVKIDKGIVRIFFDYLIDNPAVSIPILVSLIGFLGWYIKHRLDKKKSGG